MQGTIKKLVSDKGFGFIESSEAEKDVFFHSSALADGYEFNNLREGDAVTFEIEESPKGLQAAEKSMSVK